ncbi:hypothetical protein PR048_022226 [Dryococelus australis]|uniref:Uncharacterized protein n=1 Tax=Dryococelus australis TaxID=614101 RepID=A0ABQ9H0E1_9NEOP|nr:hypothetical protein PR048_022226 [Dryococelus australis]
MPLTRPFFFRGVSMATIAAMAPDTPTIAAMHAPNLSTEEHFIEPSCRLSASIIIGSPLEVSYRNTQCDENTASQFRTSRLAAMGEAVSPLSRKYLVLDVPLGYIVRGHYDIVLWLPVRRMGSLLLQPAYLSFSVPLGSATRWRDYASILSSALKEMFKMTSISTNTCINPPLYGHPDALMNPWKIPDCFATPPQIWLQRVPKSSTEVAYTSAVKCPHKYKSRGFKSGLLAGWYWGCQLHLRWHSTFVHISATFLQCTAASVRQLSVHVIDQFHVPRIPTAEYRANCGPAGNTRPAVRYNFLLPELLRARRQQRQVTSSPSLRLSSCM